jgi:hypothetical protein
MTREEAIKQLKGMVVGAEWLSEYMVEALEIAINALEQEPRKITYEDVKGYCKPRCLTIIDNELLYELTHPKIKALEQEPFINKSCISEGVCHEDKVKVLDKIRAELDEQTEIHSDGEFYIKNIDVKRIIDKYTKGESE